MTQANISKQVQVQQVENDLKSQISTLKSRIAEMEKKEAGDQNSTKDFKKRMSVKEDGAAIAIANMAAQMESNIAAASEAEKQKKITEKEKSELVN